MTPRKAIRPRPTALPLAPREAPVEPAAFPVVGIGASAGGLAAFEAFFSGFPADTEPGMAFVLVQHLAPDHKSMLTDLIQRYTRMRVFEVEDGMAVRPNCAYIIPPNRDMAFVGGCLALFEPVTPRGQRLPIDFFFRSLALDQRERAIGIVLSGTGSDGTLGIRAIKGEGGMAMAQTPASTEYEGMPRSVLATGLVDYELPPPEMGAQLIAYAAHAFGRPPVPARALAPRAESALKKIFVLLRSHTGHDFSQYKLSTIQRRIERRMAVNQIAAAEDYLSFLQKAPAEVEALFRDLLIGVTNFFRDPEAFQALEEALPRIFAGKAPGAAVRAWVPGCSTGEEAYSIAILLQERAEALKLNVVFQVFATDIDNQAVATARAGVYPASIANDLTPERLRRFFTPEADASAYRIHKTIRDMLIFSEQDLIKDPPFTKLDLLSCRNLLIYLGGELQRKLIPLFHYALNPDGLLFLGTSESVGEYGELFQPLDRKTKIYGAKGVRAPARGPALAQGFTSLVEPAGPRAARAAATPKPAARELAEKALLALTAPPSALVDAQGDILYLHGRTGMFLEPAPGEAGPNNILRMAREGLRRELAAALQRVRTSQEPERIRGLRVRTNGHHTLLDLGVHPVPAAWTGREDGGLFLVVLEASETPAPAVSGPPDPEPGRSEARIEELVLELRSKEEYLRSANEELETSNEELKSSNEEMQSVNEELQSTNEELETSKEELQSVNEELATVNAELQAKVTDLSRAYNDMNNLLAGTGIATVFVDHQLRLMRFTPATTRIIHLIPSDVGRPVGHVLSNLEGYSSLMADTQAVLDTLIPREQEVRSADGRWYTLRIQPYRTLENVIEGAVITFVDITEIIRMKDDLGRLRDFGGEGPGGPA